MHVLDVEIDDQQRLVLNIESGQLEAGCPACGVGGWPWPSGAARCAVLRPVTLARWLVRIWRGREPLRPTQTFTEAHDIAPSQMVLTTRAVIGLPARSAGMTPPCQHWFGSWVC
jgi:hypothetical protein